MCLNEKCTTLMCLFVEVVQVLRFVHEKLYQNVADKTDLIRGKDGGPKWDRSRTEVGPKFFLSSHGNCQI